MLILLNYLYRNSQAYMMDVQNFAIPKNLSKTIMRNGGSMEELFM
jgi:hypothetical protein